MGFTRRRSDRPDQARFRLGSNLEHLESRALLATSSSFHSFYTPTDLPPRTISHGSPPIRINHPIGSSERQLSFLDNDGKVVTGKDRAGNEYTITVHGPGVVIVTDATPNDGILADDIDTIQLVGTSLRDTYVTGQVLSSFKVQTDGTTQFNRLLNVEGVASIILNGFTLAQTVAPPVGTLNNINTGIFLEGGVGTLQFHNIEAPIDLATGDLPINIIIGASPIEPRIRLDSIFNTVINTATASIPTDPQVNPTVNIIVNGQVRSLDMISSTQAPIEADTQYAFPTVGTTGRTAIAVNGIDRLKVLGSAENLTASRSGLPFQSGLTGMTHIGRADFGGNADALGLDVAGPIHRLRFARGLGNPVGSSRSATAFGTPASEFGYPSVGLVGGLVTASDIRQLKAGPANLILQTAGDPDYVQERRKGSTRYYSRPGNAFTSAIIASSGSIGETTVVGNAVSSEIKAGFHYPSFIAGLEGTRNPSRIGPVRYRGDLVDSVVSSTYRPFRRVYGTPADVVGPGSIRGRFEGNLVQTGSITALGNRGTGFFAARKDGYLPPPETSRRVHSVLTR